METSDVGWYPVCQVHDLGASLLQLASFSSLYSGAEDTPCLACESSPETAYVEASSKP